MSNWNLVYEDKSEELFHALKKQRKKLDHSEFRFKDFGIRRIQ